MKYMDPRVKFSRQKLKDALVSLTLEQGYESISIQALTDRAKVGYATFHRHYTNIDELAERLLKGAVADLDESVCQKRSPVDEALFFWRYVKDNQGVFRFYLALPPKHPARNVFLSGSAYFVTQRYQARNPDRVPLDVAVLHMVQGLENLLILYLDDIEAFSPEQMATFFHDLIIQAAAIKPRPEWLQENPAYQLEPV